MAGIPTGRITPPFPYPVCPHCQGLLAAEPQTDGWYTLLCIICGREWADWHPKLITWRIGRPAVAVPVQPAKPGPHPLLDAA